MRFVLASGSAARRQILSAVGVPFTARPADLDEECLKAEALEGGADVEAVAGILADAKALHVSGALPDAIVLGADQTLLFEDELVGKSPDLVSARALLLRLRGKTHRLVSALALARGGAVVWRHVAISTLTMRDFSDALLETYLSTEAEAILGCVGCYRLEGPGAQLFESVEGDYFSILGLPLQPLLAELRKQGVIAT